MTGVKTLRIPPLFTAKSVAELTAQLNSFRATASLLRLEADGEDPNSFCTGYSPAAHSERAFDHSNAFNAFAELLLAIRNWPHLVVCVIGGRCIGGGMAFCGLSDWVIATDAATFSLPELWRGAYPAMVFPCLTQRLSPQRARALAFLASAVDATMAQEWGLVDERCQASQLEEITAARLRKFLRLQPDAVASFKSFAHSCEGLPLLENSVRAGAEATGQRFSDPAVQARFLRTDGGTNL